MRTLCDVCESAAAILFCASDEAALCRACDETVHLCNKLASRHIRVGLADPSDAPHCDICENAPAFFYCGIDGSSLCLQCDMIVHVGGKRTHGRYLLLRQQVEFPEDINGRENVLGSQPVDPSGEGRRESNSQPKVTTNNNHHHWLSAIGMLENITDGVGRTENKLFDLNARPQRMHGKTSNNQELGMEISGGTNDCASVVPVGSFKNEAEK